MPREDRMTWKSNYFLKITQPLNDYSKYFTVGADNVGSKQMQQILMSLRGKAVVLMGKNTMMRRAIRGHLENSPTLEKLFPHIRGNVGFVFIKENLSEIRDMLLAHKVPVAAHVGEIASWHIEILSDVQLIKSGDKVGASEVALLNISPFSFVLIIQQVLDSGSIYSPEVLDITEQALHSGFLEGVRNVASVKAFLTDPSAFVAAAPVAAATTSAPAAAAAAATAAPAKAEARKSEESDMDMEFGLFN
ncbi:hypothetical protein U0070_009937 [Myodes glareolus]|uniref:Large ribosomal subunit protein uL10 n=1 Tax=Myodes glareolus TaxID=447135 RepID=A0AAW0JIW6_MYOGA